MRRRNISKTVQLKIRKYIEYIHEEEKLGEFQFQFFIYFFFLSFTIIMNKVLKGELIFYLLFQMN